MKPEETEKFLNNFNLKEAEQGKYVQYERFKVLKKVGKALIFVFIALMVIGFAFARKG